MRYVGGGFRHDDKQSFTTFKRGSNDVSFRNSNAVCTYAVCTFAAAFEAKNLKLCAEAGEIKIFRF